MLTPECGNLRKTVKMATMMTLVMVSIVCILLLIAIIYNYVKKIPNPDTNNEEASKKKVVGGLTIAALVVSIPTVLGAVWSLTIANKAWKACETGTTDAAATSRK